jgi:protein SCO1/2
MRTLGPAAAEVQVLFITVDPERDTAAVLAGYTPYFNPSFIGLRGDAAATQQAATVFAVTYGKRPADSGEYAMDHSANTYLISRSGRTVLMSPYGEPDAVLADDLRQLLAMPH